MALMDLLPRRKEKTVEVPPPPALVPVSHKGSLHIGGMPSVEWDTAVPASVERARSLFRSARSAGYVAMLYKPSRIWGGSDGEVIREFDPEADAIRMSLPYAGG